MQKRFLPVFSELNHTTHALPVKGLWLVHSDEPLILQWLIDALKTHWQQQNQIIERLELNSPKSWHDVINRLNTLSLFDENTALVVTGKHKPDQKIIKSLSDFAQDVHNGQSNNHLLWCLPKQDKKSLTTKAIRLFDDMGVLIDGNIYNEQLRHEILNIKAQQLGLTLSVQAWQLLLSHTEHNLLTAFQTLWRISYLYQPTDMIDTHQLMEALVEGSQFDIFSLSDSLLMADVCKSLKILYHLKHTDTTPSMILWVMSKDARLISQIQAGKDPQTLGIWQNKIPLYQQAAQRSTHLSSQWAEQIYTIDKTIKGIGQHDVWQLLQQLAVSLCGIRQIKSTTHL